MKLVRHTLVSDGPTDANLIPIIDWTLRQVGGVESSEGVRADLWRLPRKPEGFKERLVKAYEMFPCDVLFVHRDAERVPADARREEIQAALREAGLALPAVAVVPVRMLEAWFLFDERAVRKASGNPNGKSVLNLPPLGKVESRPDPKADLKQALRDASELSGRRLKKFDTDAAFWRLADHIEDFSSLRLLPSFSSFEQAIRNLQANDWRPGFYG